MAMVTEQKKSKGQRFGEALQGVGKSINTGIQLADKLKTAETQRDVLNQQKEKLGQDMKVQKSEVMQKGLGTIASIAKTAAEMPAGKERDFFVNQNLAALAAGYEAVGAPVPDKSVVAGYTSMYAEKQSKFADLQASWSKTIKDNPGARTPDQYLQDAYKLLPSLPPEGQAVFSKVFLPNMMEGHQQALLKEEQAGIETEARNRGLVQTKLVDGKKTFEKVKKGPSEQDKEFFKMDAKSISAEMESAKDAGKLDETYDRALKLLNQVSTGKAVGNKPVAELRKFFGDEKFELLDNILSNVGMETIKTFASEAGARAIDSEGERAYLEKTFPSTDKTPENNRTILLIAKGQVAQKKALAEAKNKHFRQFGNLDNFENPLDATMKVYHPKTFDVKITKEGEIPNGYEKLSSRFGTEEGSKPDKTPSTPGISTLMMEKDGKQMEVARTLVEKAKADGWGPVTSQRASTGSRK